MNSQKTGGIAISIFAAIRSIVTSDVGCSSIIGTRLTRSTLPDDFVLPAITLDGISGVGWKGNSSRTLPLKGTVFQLSCWAETSTESTDLANAVAECLHSYSGTSEGIPIGAILVTSSPDAGTTYDQDTKMYMTPVDVVVRYN